MDATESELISRVLRGDADGFEPIVQKYSPRLFAMARRYARRESEVEDIVQEIWIKAHQKLGSFRGEAPFEHWLMRLAIRTCYDFLRVHRQNREDSFSELPDDLGNWLDALAKEPASEHDSAEAARLLLDELLKRLSPAARLVITLLEIEGRSVKEIARLTGWSVPLVKVRAFRARAEMKKIYSRLDRDKYL